MAAFLFFQALVNSVQVFFHAGKICFLAVAAFNSIYLLRSGTNLARQCFRCFGAYRFFYEDSFYIVLLAVGCQLGQVLRAWFAAGKNILDALLLQAKVTAQISKGSMAGDKVLLLQLAEFFLVGNKQRLELFVVFCGVMAVEISISPICSSQCFGNILYLCLRAAQAQPGVRVILAVCSYFVSLCKADAVGTLGCFYNDELGIGGGLCCIVLVVG